jgi:hypothetical protein
MEDTSEKNGITLLRRAVENPVWKNFFRLLSLQQNDTTWDDGSCSDASDNTSTERGVFTNTYETTTVKRRRVIVMNADHQ